MAGKFIEKIELLITVATCGSLDVPSNFHGCNNFTLTLFTTPVYIFLSLWPCRNDVCEHSVF